MSEPLRETRSTCPYCGTGCGVIIESRGPSIVAVRGDPEHPANFGKLCPKGQSLAQTAAPEVIARSRLLRPTLRATRDAAPANVGWDAALANAADRFAAAIRDHGPDSVAFYVSGQLLTEDYYAFNKLARALVGTNNIDSNSRLCMSSAVVGYKRTLGADAPPCSYADLEAADCLFVIGANPAAAHPVLFGRLLEARRLRGAKLVVADPRASETARAADLHLALQPGTDLYLLTALLGVMLRDGLIDPAFIADHTAGFDAAAAQARALPLADAARITGLAVADIERAARLFARSPATLSLWCQGLNQSSHGSDNTAALIHLHLATGQIGRVGAGPFSLTGQPNAMGGRETGSMATLLPGHRDPASAADRAELAAAWGVDDLPTRPGLTAVELFAACARGEIKALWIACTNPAQSLPDQAAVAQALAAVPFVVVQDAFATETTACADLVLPAATWGEREGTMSNSERRIALSRAAVAPPGEARCDWAIAAAFGRELAARIAPKHAPKRAPERSASFAWASSEAVFDEYKALTAGRDLDIAALDYARLSEAPVAWPYRDGAGTERLYTDGRYATPDGRARFVPFTLRGAANACSAERPLALTTVRWRDQWHGASRSSQAQSLPLPAATLQIAAAAAAGLGLTDGDLVEIETAHGRLALPLQFEAGLAPGVAAVAMHLGAAWMPGSRGVNALTQPALDPLSRQPELKHVPAAIRAHPAAWHAALVLCVPLARKAALLAQLRERLAAADYAAIALFAAAGGAASDGTAAGIAVSLAALERDAALADDLRAAAGIAADAPALSDARSGRVRVLQIAEGRLAAAWLEGPRRSELAAAPLYQKLIAAGGDCAARPLRELFAPEWFQPRSTPAAP